MGELQRDLDEARGEIRRLEGAAEDLASAEDDAEKAKARADKLQARLDEVLTEATGLLDRLVEFGREAQRWTAANRNVR